MGDAMAGRDEPRVSQPKAEEPKPSAGRQWKACTSYKVVLELLSVSSQVLADPAPRMPFVREMAVKGRATARSWLRRCAACRLRWCETGTASLCTSAPEGEESGDDEWGMRT